MNTQLNHMIARQRSTELERAGERARLASEVSAGQRSSRDPNPVTRLSAHLAHLAAWSAPTRFTLHGRHVAKLDRYVGQAQRAALRAEREFEGVTIEVDNQGTVSVCAIGMTSMLL